ncbi:MAG: type II toxin-antitoxin system mRNA interferase toxin, RelE/StbE family [bacterium]|nr:type II toxin-antitoxin system mRNA interferase toxin, RelE/StbE family [bacterium]
MKILPLHKELEFYLKRRGLKNKFLKQRKLFESNPLHPSLNTELLEPKHLKIWSFRIDRQYRAIFIFHKKDIVEIIDINNHYK